MTITELIDALNIVEAREFKRMGYTHPPDVWHAKPKRKYINLDCGGSGAFLVEIETGELFNIKAYGVADQNKKRKANLGNIATVDAEQLHRRRWNYLR